MLTLEILREFFLGGFFFRVLTYTSTPPHTDLSDEARKIIKTKRESANALLFANIYCM